MTREQLVRAYANHLGLMVRGPRHGPFILIERYWAKQKLGTYRSVVTLERAIRRHGDRMLREIKLKKNGRDGPPFHIVKQHARPDWPE